jgi:hypothetical protein
MDPKGKGIVVNDKEKESLLNELRDDKPTESGSSHKKRDGKKKGTSRRPLMNFLLVTNPMYLTFVYLGANATFW